MGRGDRKGSAASTLWASLLALAILTAAVRLPFAPEPPGRDQGLFMTQASLLASGGRLYADVWEHKQPGIVALYGAAMALGGDDYTSIQLLHALAGFITAALLLLLLRRAGLSGLAAFSAGALYLLFYGGPVFGGFWATAQVEIFIDPCVAAALHGLLPRARAADPVVGAPLWGRLFAAGFALGTAVFWLKYSCAPLAGLALLALSSRATDWAPRTPAAQGQQAWQTNFARVAWVGAGMSLPLVLMLLYFAWSGRVGEFWDATIGFNLAHRNVALFQPESAAHWIALVFIKPAALALLYLFSALALVARFAPIGSRESSGGAAARGSGSARDRLFVASLFLWLLALGQIVLQGKFWIYHYHVVLLPLSISAAIGLEWLALQRLRERVGGATAWSVTGVIALMFFWPHASLLAEYATVHRVGEYWGGELSPEEFRASYRWGAGDYDAAENRAVAVRVAQETEPGEAIFVWGFEPSIYRLSERAPASRFLYDYPLMPELGEWHERHVEWLMDDLAASEPALFLVLQRDSNDLEGRDSASQLRALPPLREFLARHYRPAWTLGDFKAFRRLTPAL